jgi:hypothetical protein
MMPVKIFTGSAADGVAALEAQVNAWMSKLEAGAVRQINTATGQAATPQIVVSVWYTEARDSN